MQKIITLRTDRKNGLYDITSEVARIVEESKVHEGIVSVYARGSTAAIMIQENWDPNIRTDVVNCLQNLVPQGVWRHDLEDGNGDAHIKAGIIGPSEVIPIADGKLLLSTWQNIFFCEFDGPRKNRDVIVTLI